MISKQAEVIDQLSGLTDQLRKNTPGCKIEVSLASVDSTEVRVNNVCSNCSKKCLEQLKAENSTVDVFEATKPTAK